MSFKAFLVQWENITVALRIYEWEDLLDEFVLVISLEECIRIVAISNITNAGKRNRYNIDPVFHDLEASNPLQLHLV